MKIAIWLYSLLFFCVCTLRKYPFSITISLVFVTDILHVTAWLTGWLQMPSTTRLRRCNAIKPLLHQRNMLRGNKLRGRATCCGQHMLVACNMLLQAMLRRCKRGFRGTLACSTSTSSLRLSVNCSSS